jgi:archaellum component FlaC
LQEANEKRIKDDQQRVEYLTQELERVRQDRDALDKECKELRGKLEGALDDRFERLDAALIRTTGDYASTMETSRQDQAETRKELKELKEIYHKTREELEGLKAWHRESLMQDGYACILQ